VDGLNAKRPDRRYLFSIRVQRDGEKSSPPKLPVLRPLISEASTSKPQLRLLGKMMITVRNIEREAEPFLNLPFSIGRANRRRFRTSNQTIHVWI